MGFGVLNTPKKKKLNTPEKEMGQSVHVPEKDFT